MSPVRGAGELLPRNGVWENNQGLWFHGVSGRGAKVIPVSRDSSKPLKARGFRISVLQREEVEGLDKHLCGEKHLETETSNKIPSNEIRSQGLD